VGQYPPKIGHDRNSAFFSGMQKRVTKLETRTSSIDSGFPMAMLPGVIQSGYTTGDPQVYVNGAAALSGPFKYLTSYTPVSGDSVLLAPLGVSRSYVVIGKLSS
jgi:hypothetical protein